MCQKPKKKLAQHSSMCSEDERRTYSGWRPHLAGITQGFTEIFFLQQMHLHERAGASRQQMCTRPTRAGKDWQEWHNIWAWVNGLGEVC